MRSQENCKTLKQVNQEYLSNGVQKLPVNNMLTSSGTGVCMQIKLRGMSVVTQPNDNLTRHISKLREFAILLSDSR